MVPVGPQRPEGHGLPAFDSHEHEIEAHLRLLAARVIIDAITEGHWCPEPEVLAHIGLLVRQADRRFQVAGWAA